MYVKSIDDCSLYFVSSKQNTHFFPKIEWSESGSTIVPTSPRWPLRYRTTRLMMLPASCQHITSTQPTVLWHVALLHLGRRWWRRRQTQLEWHFSDRSWLWLRTHSYKFFNVKDYSLSHTRPFSLVLFSINGAVFFGKRLCSEDILGLVFVGSNLFCYSIWNSCKKQCVLIW